MGGAGVISDSLEIVLATLGDNSGQSGADFRQSRAVLHSFCSQGLLPGSVGLIPSMPDSLRLCTTLHLTSRHSAQGHIQLPISEECARCWMHRLGCAHTLHAKALYFDGHEREDVVEHRKEFVSGCPLPLPPRT